ncbi:FUSC family protein [Kitasatospora sp. NPDC094015]|uniref:FUSC family protein n=1 Tax=Kitasatospora sp. NPDC094015 TaxID=3155205 RepID=UPI00331B5941
MRTRPSTSDGQTLLARLRTHDPDFAATRRAGRCAIVASALFALGMEVLHSPPVAYYAAFGCFSMLLFVDFTGPMPKRLRAQFQLAVAWAALVCLGTLAAPVTWVAVVATLVVSFLILFSGVVSSVLAGATTALLLAFVIPVSSPASYAQLPERVAGVGLAAIGSMVAIRLMWPRASTDPLGGPAARVCRTAAARLRTELGPVDGAGSGPGVEPAEAVARAEVSAAQDLRRVFDHAPYRPTGLSTGSRALVRLVDELTWLHAVLQSPSLRPEVDSGVDRGADAVRGAAAEVLDRSADLLQDPSGSVEDLRHRAVVLRAAMDSLVETSAARLPRTLRNSAEGGDAQAFLGALDVGFRAKRLGYATLQVAADVALVAEAERRTWRERLLGTEPGARAEPAASALERAGAHLHVDSVWLHNSLRGAVGLSLSVALADLTSVQHSFWVLLGTLSVLRSNALNTGQNVLRAVGGTVVGSIIGAALLVGIGHRTEVLWFVLPVAVFLVGIAPATISFAAGQAAFTITLVVIFSIGEDPDWHLAVLRVQDIALGCAVSLLVALFFWPRGAAAAIDRALAEAYRNSTGYLADAVRYGIDRCEDDGRAGDGRPLEAQRRAAAAARRLDDAFRSYLAERGAKPMALADMTTLVTGVVRLRLAADAVLSLWRRAAAARLDEAGSGARHELLAGTEAVAGWYRSLAESLARHTAVRSPVEEDVAREVRLVRSLRRDLLDDTGAATANAVRLIWTGDYVESARQLQPRLADAAATAGHQHAVEAPGGSPDEPRG